MDQAPEERNHVHGFLGGLERIQDESREHEHQQHGVQQRAVRVVRRDGDDLVMDYLTRGPHERELHPQVEHSDEALVDAQFQTLSQAPCSGHRIGKFRTCRRH